MAPRKFVYTLKVGLAGVPEPLCLRITEKEAERFDLVLRDYQGNDISEFFVWDSPAGATIVLSLRDLQFASILWDRPAKVAKDPPLPDKKEIDIRLRGRPPMRIDMGMPIDLIDLLFRLDSLPGTFEGFLDGDGEQYWFRPDQLVYMSVPKWIMREGQAAFDERKGEQDAEEQAHLERAEAAEQLIAEVGGKPAPSKPKVRRGQERPR